ncbi:hypothetical protein OI25_8018 (plasmid) [Paraburkholderia fungorum]|jgi:hypothetical protein|uniref:Uncharacterized protein n=1 Tax=Paraburkholderia fungorum TaxID=134537 RepID=A0AAU8SY85_9BURK|nr:hypothetical protein OI25_8018 [Paraburkholderia fungorum]
MPRHAATRQTGAAGALHEAHGLRVARPPRRRYDMHARPAGACYPSLQSWKRHCPMYFFHGLLWPWNVAVDG